MTTARGLVWYYGVVAGIVVVGFGLSAFIYWAARTAEESRVREAFELRSEWRVRDIQDKINAASVPVEALADFIPSQLILDPAEFHRFAVQARRDDPISRLEWAPLVTKAGRASFEAEARQSGLADYAIGGIGPDGKVHAEEERDEYVPTRLIELYDGSAPVFGLDLMFDKARMAIVDAARDSGEPVAAPPLPFIATPNVAPFYIVLSPVYRTRVVPATMAERHATFSGMVVGVYPVDALMKFITTNTREIVGTLDLLIDHRDGDPFGVPIGRYNSVGGTVEIPTRPLGPAATGSLRMVRTFRQFGHDWTLVDDYPAAIVDAQRSSSQWVYLAFGLMLTLGLAAYVLAEGRRRLAVEIAVAERTRDLRQTSERLASVSTQMKAIIDASPVAIVARDIAGNMTLWNRAAEELVGYSASEVIGHPPPPGFAADPGESKRRFELTMQGQILHGLETVRHRRDGRMIETMSSQAALFNSDGAFEGTVAVIEDVTESKAANAKLLEAQMLLAGIVSSANDAMVSKTIDGIVTTWNRAAEAIFGFTAEEMIGRPISVLAAPGHEDDMLVVLDRVRRDERIDSYETRRRRKDGAILDIVLTVSPIHDADGRIIGASKIARDITGRRAAMAQLRLLGSAFEQSGEAICILDPDRRFTLVNSAFTKITGYTLEEVKGRRAADFLAANESSFSTRKDVVQKMDQDGYWHGESLARRKDGTEFTQWMTRSAVHDESGNVTNYVTAFTDISDRKRAEHRVAKLNQMYSILSRTNHAITHITDRDTLFEDVCQIAVEHGGLALACIGFRDVQTGGAVPASIAGPASGYMHEIIALDQAIAMIHLSPGATVLRDGRPAIYSDIASDPRFEVRRDSAARYGLRSAAAFPLASEGEVVGSLSFYSTEANYFDDPELVQLLTEMAGDISFGLDSMKRDADREESDQRFRQIAENIREVFWLDTPGNGKMLYISPAYREIWGRDPDELYANSQSWGEAVHPDDREATRHAALTKQANGTYDEQFRIVRPDGDIRWIHARAFPVKDESGTVIRIAGIAEDITKSRLAEIEHELLGRQLSQAQKMEAIGQLTGGLAHDFNNLLGVVLGNLDILQDIQEAGSDERSLTDAAIHAAVRGAELTKQLLAFARKQPLAPKMIDLGAVLEGSAQLLRRTLGEHVGLGLKVPDGLWPVLIDASQLESAILNLAVNSRDAMPNGGRLTVEARNITLEVGAAELNLEALPGDYVTIAVSDTGTGMSPEILAKVFEPFFSTKGNKGTGLGLSMVHGFVKQSGGHTKIYSEPGHGTTVRMYLPRAADDDSKTGIGIDAPSQIKGNEVILVVEDNKGLRDVAVRQLQGFGYRTIPASDGAQALEIIQGGTPIDLLFSDVVMPGGMDGRALAKAARHLRPELKVLFTSGFTAAAASAAMTDDFGSNLLSKPYRKEELGRRVRAAIDGC